MTREPSIRRFVRDLNSHTGFQSANRASTDAINSLEQWKSKGIDRDYQVQHDNDNELVAMLTIDVRDTTAGPDLDAECAQYGVTHATVSLMQR
ncbi:hypothetical protein [Cupriavidus taiwanensis]|uniref:hypothetical protein n=1 Tax=Cupriavidus taiwanensis TaxID=164546 RepID=UPI00046F7118|nr:hypothetical protein [Cupriavidus taiwanensis]SOZ05321.1 hypothetical protein CBM2595_A80006 [Cupriavidus taiwanensis]